jgi:hypothetical protein
LNQGGFLAKMADRALAVKAELAKGASVITSSWTVSRMPKPGFLDQRHVVQAITSRAVAWVAFSKSLPP